MTHQTIGRIAVLFLLAGCAGKPGEDGRCDPGRACSRPCAQDAECSGGEVCLGGVCGQAAPTSTRYVACGLDADCPRGDHCSLGACAHDCLTDRDCGGGNFCTSRGRCAGTIDAAVSPPPVTPPPPARLDVSATVLDLGATAAQEPLTLSNGGGAPISFRILSDKPWLSAEPSSGTLSDQPAQVIVRVDRAAAGAETHGTLRINSTGGNVTLSVHLARDLSGTYAGQVRYTQPFEVAASALHLSFSEGSGGTLGGFVEPERSLLFPFQAAVSGAVVGDEVTLSFTLVGEPGSLVNPGFPLPIERVVTLEGRVTGTGVIEGQLTEVLSGVVEGQPLTVRGMFRLERSGLPLAGVPEPAPGFLPVAVDNPFLDPAYDICRSQCPRVGGCGDPLSAGASYLGTAANLYASFQEIAGATGNPFDIARNNCGGRGCLNAVALRCSQYHYARPLLSGAGGAEADAAAIGLLDALEVMADYGALFGNDKLVAAGQAWRTAGSLASELPVLEAAAGFFSAGSHALDPAQPLAMLDPFFLKLLFQRVGPTALASPASNLPALLGDAGVAHTAGYEHLRRQLLAVAGALRARLGLAERQHRLGQLAAARTTAARGAEQAYLDLVILGALLDRAGATPAGFPDIRAALADFQELSRRFDDLHHGRNPAGYLPGYVPFFLDVTRLPKNNYTQVWEYAQQVIYATLALPEEGAARASAREFETSFSAYGNQVQPLADELDRQLLQLCGTADIRRCGAPGSALEAAAGELRAAALRMNLVETRIRNLAEEVRIEHERARQVAGIHTAQAELILSSGERLNALVAEAAIVDGIAASQMALTGIIGGIINLGRDPAQLVNAVGSALASATSIPAKASIEQRRNTLQAYQSAQVAFDQARETLANSAAAIKTKLLESATLAVEQELARESLVQAGGAVLGVHQRALQLAQQRAALRAHAGTETRRMLQFRLYSDNLELRARDSFRLLLRWAYLATRAMEYELNLTYPDAGSLWLSRTSDEINGYLVRLDTFYQSNRPGPPQTNVEVISARDELLDLDVPAEDKVTGATYSPRERFRRYVNDPNHRDVNGNLHLTFATHRPDKPLFSRAVCNDRIKSIRINLIGDNLGAGMTTAFVSLSHGGTNHLRSCAGGELVGYDFAAAGNKPRIARVQAGVNAPQNAAGLPANTDLLSRALLASQWELIIDQRPGVEPVNARLDLTELDDIELILEHESYTLQ